jgi:ADP-ribosylglycohydrolase
MPTKTVRAALLGIAVGDALGLPYEFRPRHELEREPVSGMSGWGTWNRAPGTWGEDSSLCFCLAETLCAGYDLHDLAARLVAWKDRGYWTADGTAFSVGRSVEVAIARLRSGVDHPARAGLRREQDNGNGALMRILPAAFFVRGKSADERAWILAEIASLTHGHRRSQLACIFFVEMTLGLLSGRTPADAYRIAVMEFSSRFADESELARFGGILTGKLQKLPRKDVVSSGYVIETLEAAVWCLLTTDNFRDAALAAVNLGGDTDTVASMVGGLSGIAYGEDSIPAEWIAVLSRRADIEDLADRLEKKLSVPTSTFVF